MLKLKKAILFKIVIMTCILMQIIMSLPHHHHDGLGAACVNPIHCITECNNHQQEEHTPLSFGGHDHDQKGDFCSYNQIYLLISARDQSDQIRPLYTLLLDAPQWSINLAGCESELNHSDNISNINISINQGVVPLYMAYVSKALPSRAPTA